MAYRKIKLFLASPGDVRVERKRLGGVVDALNSGPAEDKGVVFQLLRWEDFSRPGMGRPQGLINSWVGAYEVFLGIMWQRFGSPTGKAGSGTEEEFRLALERWRRTGGPEILFYFNRTPIPPPRTAVEAHQLLKLSEFREVLERVGALVWEYQGTENLAEEVRKHLEGLLRDSFSQDGSGLASRLLACLNDTVNACRQRNVPFQTVELLVTLLANPAGETSLAFTSLEPDLDRRLHTVLSKFIASRRSGQDGGFQNFDWRRHEHLVRARELAAIEGCNTVLERHLALTFLDLPSGTRDSLKQRLSEGQLDQLRVALEGTQSPLKPAGTPGDPVHGLGG